MVVTDRYPQARVAYPLRSAPLAQVMRVVDGQIGRLRARRSGGITAERRDRHEGGPGIGIGQHAFEVLVAVELRQGVTQAGCPGEALVPSRQRAARL